MALKIRLRQQGRTNRLTYRLVVTDSRSPRDGKYIENLGYYDPHMDGGKDGILHQDRIQHWIDLGAELTEKATTLIARKTPGVIQNLREKAAMKIKKRSEKRKGKNFP